MSGATHAERVRGLAGTQLAPSRWILIDQDAINLFADATQDHQWIHVDPERAARESPFGATVAHGMLTLGLGPRLLLEALELLDAPLVINYGLNKVRFPAPLRAGTRVRLHATVAEVTSVPGGIRATVQGSFEAEGGERPVCVGEFLLQVGDG